MLMSSTITTAGRPISSPMTRVCETWGPVCLPVAEEPATVASENQKKADKKATPAHSKNIERHELSKYGNRMA